VLARFLARSHRKQYIRSETGSEIHHGDRFSWSLTWTLRRDGGAHVFLTWFVGTEPTVTPVMRPEVYAEAIENAKRIVTPPA